MNQSKAFVTSLVFAMIAMGLVYFWVTDREASIKSRFGTEKTVVVARVDINEFAEIKKDMLTTKVIPDSFFQPGAQADPDIFEGSVASAPVKAGEQMLITKVLLKGAETGLSSQVAISHRAVSIPVSEVTGVTKLMRPGDRIDIIASVPYQTPNGQESEVKTLLQNVHVLAVGKYIQNNIPQAFEEDPFSGNRKAKNLRGSEFSTVTVEVTPIEAQNLIFVMQAGAEIFLSLRNPVDRAELNIPTTTVDEVLGSDSKKAKRELASRLSPPLPPVAPVRPVPRPASNPFNQGGGSLVP